MAPVASSSALPALPSSVGPAPPPLTAPPSGARDRPSNIAPSNVMPSVAPTVHSDPTSTPMDVDALPAAETLLDDVDTSEIY